MDSGSPLALVENEIAIKIDTTFSAGVLFVPLCVRTERIDIGLVDTADTAARYCILQLAKPVWCSAVIKTTVHRTPVTLIYIMVRRLLTIN